MPLAARTIEPIYLGRRPLKKKEEGEEVAQVAITQNAVLGALVQLASLVRHADDLFCDLADECQKVFEHTERIIHSVKRIKEKVGRLDSKSVSIPVGDLKKFSSTQEHHVARHGFDCSFFTPDVRPHCIKFRYSLCEVTPVGILRGADPYRKDGLRSSELFKLWPIVLKEHQAGSPDLSLNRRQGRAMTFNKKYKRLKQRSKTLPDAESVKLFQESRNKDNVSVSSVDTNSLSRSQPSILVAVDTTGTGFHRMTSFRQTLKGTASLDRKTQRRRTVSGVPDSILREIESFERGKRTVRTMPRNYSFDDLDSRREPDRDEAMMQYLDEMDAKMEEKAEQARANRDVKLLKFLPCRRSRSLPRCMKVKDKDTPSPGVMTFEGDGSKDRTLSTATSGYASSSLSLGSAGTSSTSSRTTRRSSIISNKLKSFVNNTLRPRPKSLDFDTVNILSSEADNEEDDNAHSKVNNLTRKISPSMPDDISSLSSSRESKVGPGTYYYFTSSTVPRAQARKYDFPWESLPKDWTTSVKLREISKRRREERNSSSGNWSGSSNRQSLDSERDSSHPSTSRLSLGRDSGRDSMGDDREDSPPGDKSQVESGISSFMPTTTSPTSTASDTEQWLASLAQRAAAREDAAAAGSDVTESLARLSELTKQNILALEETFSPGKPDVVLMDDEVSSVYSLDQDGFYTSFHTDSGLRRSTGTLLDDDGALTSSRDTHSLLSLGSSNTIDSVIFRPMGNVTPGMASGTGKVRPPPPVRSGSRLSSRESLMDADDKLKAVGHVQSQTEVTDSEVAGELSPTDSDQEVMYARLQAKTKISPHSIPSWCSVSDEDSPDNSHSCLTRGNLQDATSLSFSGSAPDGDASVVGGTESESTHKDLADGSWNLDSLPRRYLESKVWEEDLSDQSNSWPRSRRSQHPPTVGILKREKSPAGSLKPKTLNFAPVVNMFDHHTRQGVQLPLNAASSTSSSSCSSDTSTAGLAFTLSHPASPTRSRLSRSLGDVKYNPSGLLTAGDNARVMSNRGHHQVGQVYMLSQVKGKTDVSSESSVSSSETSLRSESDGGQSGYTGHSSLDTLSSSSSARLSDIDSSLTYVSMSSSNSTPTNSTLALDPDDVPTPVNSPTPPHVSCPMSQQASSSLSANKCVTGDRYLVLERAPTCHVPPAVLQQTATRNAVADNTQVARHSLGSFAADANTEAAPTLWIGERANIMTSSADSGFSSPTSPTKGVTDSGQLHPHHNGVTDSGQLHPHHQGVTDSGQLHPHHQGVTDSGQLHPHHQHGHHNDHSTQLSQTVGRPPQQVTSIRGSPVYGGEGSHVADKNSRRRRDHTINSLPKRCTEQREESLRTSHSDGVPMGQQAPPRSDSYRAATGDFERISRQQRNSDSSWHGAKHRSHSSSHMPSKPHIPHERLHTSASCPSGVLADPDGVTRADSYRLAVRNTQGVVGDVATRNSSYRIATGDDDAVVDDRMEAINCWDRRQASGHRDVRRMGITDIDQLKSYDSDSSTSKGSSSSRINKSPSRGFAGINSSHKKMSQEVDNLLRGDKTPSPEVKRMPRVTLRGGKDKDKDKDKGKKRSSTYIRFDPIFEQGDGMYASTDTLRAESVEMITCEEELLMSDKVVGQLPPGRVRVGGGRRNVDDKATHSIFGSIKTTFKSMSGKHSTDRDMWKYDSNS